MNILLFGEKNKNPAHKIFVETVIKTIQKKMYETRNFTTTVQIQPSLSYQTEIKHTTLAIPNPKTVFAIASFQKQKKSFRKIGKYRITGGREDISNHSKAFNKRVAKASQQGV